MCRARISFALALSLSCWAVPGAGAAQDESDAPVRLSEFTLEALDGQVFRSAQELGERGALITFWRLDQEPSLRMLKDLKQLYDEVPKHEIAIVSIVAGTVERSVVATQVKELEIAFPVLFDPDRRIYAELGVIVSPSTWFVDRSGLVLDDYPGHRRDFLRVARANTAFLRGSIAEAERLARVQTRARPPLELEQKELAGVETRYQLALRLLDKGRCEAAMAQLRKVWESDPPLVTAGVKLGLLLLEDARNAEALEIFERATELVPTDPVVWGARGVALLRLGQEREGAELLRRALQQPVEEPLLYYEMAKLSERSGELDEARGYYRKGLELMLADRAIRRGD